MRAPLIAIALVVFSPMALGDIYKHVDQDGRVVFTDQPPDENAEQIELEPINSIPKPTAAPEGATSGTSAAAAFSGYKALNIDGPADGTTLHDPTEPLVIGAWADPQLQPGHSFVILHNGRAESGSSNTLVVQSPERGTHTFVAQIRDAGGALLIQSKPLQVHVQRTSLLSPGRRKAGGN